MTSPTGKTNQNQIGLHNITNCLVCLGHWIFSKMEAISIEFSEINES